MQCGRPGFDPRVEKVPWRQKRLLTPVFLPKESQGQRSLAGYSPRGCKELDMTKQLSTYVKIRFRHKEKERFLLYIFWLCS